MQEVGGSIPPGSTSFHIGDRSIFLRPASPSSRGLGHIPFTDATGVRIPVGTPILDAGTLLGWRRAGDPRRAEPLTGARSICWLAAAGKLLVIARAGKPVARLMPIVATESRSGVRFGGINYKKLKLSRDFHAPLTDDDLLKT